MFKTYALLQVKPGCFDDFLALMRRWKRAPGELPGGFLSAVPFQSDDDPDRIMLSVVFENRENYLGCTLHAEPDAAYLEMTALLEGPPEWDDGDTPARFWAE